MSLQRGKGKTIETSNIEDTTAGDHTRQLRSTSNMDRFFKEFIKVYLTECEETRRIIKEENEETRTLLKELITTIKDSSSQTRISQLETSTMIVSKLDACHYDSMKTVKETLSQMNRSQYTEDISNAKKTIEKTWQAKYKNRNDLFWRYHRNKRLEELYSDELRKENPNIPLKFLPNYSGKETPEEKQIMQNLAKEKVRAELQLQKIRYQRQLESVKQIDNEMINLITNNFDELIAAKLQEQWAKQCETGEFKSIQEFTKKEQWFKDNWMSINQPRSNSRQPLMEDNTNYRRYNRDDYNRDRHSRNNRLRPGNEHEREQTQNRRNERQENFNNRTIDQRNNDQTNDESEEVGNTLVEMLTSINRRTSSTETVIVCDTQDNEEMNSFLVRSPSQ